MTREIRAGKQFISPHREIYKHDSVWVNPFEQWFIHRIADHSDMDENHVIGKIVEEWVSKNATVADRVEFYKTVTLPIIMEKKEKQQEEAKKNDEIAKENSSVC